jgi:PAS domain S-box-containing protein
MTAESKTREQPTAETQHLRQGVVELEACKSQHEWLLDAYRRSEVKFRNLAEDSVTGVCMIQDGFVKYANHKLAGTFGYTVDELVDNFHAKALVLAEDWPMVEDNVRLLICGEAEAIGYQFRGVQKNGRIIRLETYGSCVDYKGGPAVMGTMVEITPRTGAKAELEKEANKFRALYDLALAMTADHDLDENLSMVVEQSRKLLDFDSSYIALRDEAAGDVYMHTLSGIKTVAFKKMRLPFGSGLGGKVAETQKGVVVSDYSHEVESPVHDIVRAEGLISGIAVPIQMGQRNLGVLYGFNRDKTSFSKSDLDTLFLLGNLAAVEITRKRQEIDLRQARDDLEQKVQDRTAKLSEANEHLKQEITEREKAEDALRGSEAMLKSVLSTSPVGIGLAEDRIMKWANEAWLEMLGFENEDEVVGQGARMIYPSDGEYERVGQILYESLQTGRVTSADATFRRKDGSLFDGHIRMKAFGASDSNTASLAAISDISERKRVERALKESEQRYRALAENSLTGICLHQDGVHLYVNDRYAKDLGYSAAELIGKPVREVVAPQDREMVEQRWLDRLAGKKVPRQYQLRSLKKNGTVRWAEVWAMVIEHKGRPAILANVFDISERKAAEEALRESERKYRTILETIADGYHEVDLAGNLTLVNDSLCEILGYPREELLGANYRKLMDERDAQSVFEAYNQVYRTGKPNPGFRYQNIGKDGSRRDISVSISPIKDSDGRPHGFRGIMRDVTPEVQLQKQLIQAQKMEAIGTLAGGIAHDFNNLLQITLGYSDLLLMRKEEGDPEYADLKRIVEAARNGADLVRRLLTFSRKVEPRFRPMNLNHLIRQVEKLLFRLIPKMIAIELRLDDSLRMINADAMQLEQTLMNLAVNAGDAMPDGGKLIIETTNAVLDQEYCRAHVGVQAGEYVLLRVSDTGHGMDREILQHIFEPFYTTKEVGRGTGLGLATVYGIVKQHRGHIECKSKPVRGTAFSIYLPVIEASEESDLSKSSEMPAFGTETVLLVDDEELVRDLGAVMLREAGYKVLTAGNGKEALDLFEQERTQVSLVILDLIMPEMGGKECLKKLRKIDSQLKVLVASGLSAEASMRESPDLGVRGFVSKPFRMKELLQQVRKVLDES